jgi:DNA-binding MarR family transcriptional regulator
MAFRPTELGVLVMVNPKRARQLLLVEFKKHDGCVTALALAQGVYRSTVKRWVASLEGKGYPIRATIENMRPAE